MAWVQIEPYKIVVVKSLQICAGAGGYTPADLFSALKDAQGCDTSVLLGTSCKCHAVVSAFQQGEWLKQRKSPLGHPFPSDDDENRKMR